MVVTKDETDGLFIQGFLQNDPWVSHGSGEAAGRNCFEMDDPVRLIQEDYCENLLGEVCKSGLQESGDGGAVGDDRLVETFRRLPATTEFHGSRNPYCLGQANTSDRCKIPYGEPAQFLQIVSSACE